MLHVAPGVITTIVRVWYVYVDDAGGRWRRCTIITVHHVELQCVGLCAWGASSDSTALPNSRTDQYIAHIFRELL